MKTFDIHPHKAFLNTEICITNNKYDTITITEKKTKKQYVIMGNSSYKTKLPAGQYSFCYSENNYEQIEDILVEDAIKLGGSDMKKTFVSEKTPWVTIVMKDRTYFYNRETKKNFVEYGFVPNDIEVISKDTLLLSSSREYSIFSLSELKPILSFSDKPYYFDYEFVVYATSENNETTINIYNTLDGALLKTFKCFYYALNTSKKILYLYDGHHIETFDMSSSIQNKIIVKYNFCCFLNNSYYISVDKDKGNKGIFVYSLDSNDEVFNIPIDSNSVSRINDCEINSINILKDHFYDENKDNELILRACFNAKFHNIEIIETTNTFYYIDEIFSWSYKNYYDFIENLTSEIYNESKIKIHQISGKYYSIKQEYDFLILKYTDTIITIANGKIKSIFQNSPSLKTVHVDNGSRYMIEEKENDIFCLKNLCGDKIIVLDNECSEISTGESFYTYKKNNKYNILFNFDIPNSIKVKEYDYSSNYIYSKGNKIIVRPSNNKSSTLINSFSQCYPLSTNDICCISENGYIYICYSINGFVMCVWNPKIGLYDESIIEIESYDNTKCIDASLSPDGKHILYLNERNEHILYNIFTGEKDIFPTNISIKRISAINGYRTFVKLDSSKREPVFVDPVTLQNVPTEYLNQYRFFSPDGRYFVDSSMANAKDCIGIIKYYDLANRQHITIESYEKIENSINYQSKEIPTGIIDTRISFCLNHKEYLPYINDDIKKESLKDRTVFKGFDPTIEKLTYYLQKTPQISKVEKDCYDYYFKTKKLLTKVFFRQEELITINDTVEGTTKEIWLKEPLWYLNYISFDCAHKYVSIAGRYPNNTYDENGIHIGGLLLIYDLSENVIVYEKSNTNAVWTCSFDIKGNVAFYDSVYGTAHTYFRNFQNNEIKEINGKNFLCFSPSGKYMALSKQGYVLYKNANNCCNWGHQPSTEIFIHSTDDPAQEIATYNDHGDDVNGIKTNNICMVSFSNDDKKLLSVSKDNVVVIRNLNF